MAIRDEVMHINSLLHPQLMIVYTDGALECHARVHSNILKHLLYFTINSRLHLNLSVNGGNGVMITYTN